MPKGEIFGRCNYRYFYSLKCFVFQSCFVRVCLQSLQKDQKKILNNNSIWVSKKLNVLETSRSSLICFFNKKLSNYLASSLTIGKTRKRNRSPVFGALNHGGESNLSNMISPIDAGPIISAQEYLSFILLCSPLCICHHLSQLSPFSLLSMLLTISISLTISPSFITIVSCSPAPQNFHFYFSKDDI